MWIKNYYKEDLEDWEKQYDDRFDNIPPKLTQSRFLFGSFQYFKELIKLATAEDKEFFE